MRSGYIGQSTIGVYGQIHPLFEIGDGVAKVKQMDWQDKPTFTRVVLIMNLTHICKKSCKPSITVCAMKVEIVNRNSAVAEIQALSKRILLVNLSSITRKDTTCSYGCFA